MTARLAFPAYLEEVREGPPEDHFVLVTFPDLPEANTFGKDKKDALTNAVDCLDVSLAGRIKDGAEIPQPSLAFERHMVTPSRRVIKAVTNYLSGINK